MRRSALSLSLALGLLPVAAQSPVKVEFKDATMKLGFVAQPMFEAVGSATKEGTTQNVFLRRVRLMAGGTLGEDFEFFFETDNPNLAKADATGAKTTGGLIVQDAFITYKFSKTIKLDAGLILVPGSHHGTQGATTLLTTDYSPYAFLQSGPMGNSNGRDGGIQLRGLLGGLEFRVGAFQGKRVAQTTDRVAGNNSLRLAARAQWNFFDAENGLFLAGTYLGAKKIFSIGMAHDRQDDYQSTAVDAFLDWPVGNDGVTFQVNHVSWDGGNAKLVNGTTMAPWIALPKQKTLFAEASYRFGATKLAPIARFDQRKPDVATLALPEESRMGFGLAWWYKGHQSNLKALYQRVEPKAPGVTTLKSYDQVNVQWQLFFF